eukprot:151787_1
MTTINPADLVAERRNIFSPEWVMKNGTINKVFRMNGQNRLFKSILKNELVSYSSILQQWENIENITDKIKQCITKYNTFMLNLMNCRSTNDPNIIFLWRIHMLHPIIYKQDCINHYGNWIVPKNYTSIQLPFDQKNVDIIRFKECNFEPKCNKFIFTNFDFISSIIKNIKFMKYIVKHVSQTDITDNFLKDYQIFLKQHAKLKTKYGMHLSPFQTQDFQWHSHLLFPDCYAKDCKINTYPYSCWLDHNDLMAEHIIRERKSFCDEYWRVLLKTNSENYQNPNYKKTLLKFLVEQQIEKENANKLVYGFVDYKRLLNMAIEVINICFNYYYQVKEIPKDIPIEKVNVGGGRRLPKPEGWDNWSEECKSYYGNWSYGC